MRDSLELADLVELTGGPPDHQAGKFYNCRNVLENARDQLDTDGLGFIPLIALGWIIAAAAGIVAVATIPQLVRSTRQVTATVGNAASQTVSTLGKVTQYLTWGAGALAGYWATKVVLRKAG